MFKSKLKFILDFLENKSILITTHNTADLDGFASSFALSFFLKTILKLKSIQIYFSKVQKSVIELSQKISQKFPNSDFSFEEQFNPDDIDVIIILDTNNISQVIFPFDLELSQTGIPYIFLDHHFINRENLPEGNLSALNLVEDDFGSTSEIVCELIQEKGIEIPLYLRILLIAGILYDTGYFRFATNRTFERVANLLQRDIDYQEILLLLERENVYSERIALIKGMQRAELIKVNDWLIGISHVGSFESRVASTLLKIGYDIAIVYSEKSGEYRISTRAEKEVCLKTGLHLGKLLEEISNEFGASGGGHDGAASITIKGDYKLVFDKIITEIKEILKPYTN